MSSLPFRAPRTSRFDVFLGLVLEIKRTAMLPGNDPEGEVEMQRTAPLELDPLQIFNHLAPEVAGLKMKKLPKK